MSSKKILLVVVGIYFTFCAILHFVRMAFEMDVIIGRFYLPSWASAALIIFSVIVVYQVCKIIKEEKKKSTTETVAEEKEDKPEENEEENY